MNQKIFLLLFSCLVAFSSKAQSGILEGLVFDTLYNRPIKFGSAYIRDLNRGMYIDSLGKFKIKLPVGKHRLEVTRIGIPQINLEVSIFQDSTTYIKIGFTDSCLFSNSSKSNKKCPKCHKSNKVIPILYGLPLGEMDTENFYYAGCEITGCDSYWYCKRDKLRF